MFLLVPSRLVVPDKWLLTVVVDVVVVVVIVVVVVVVVVCNLSFTMLYDCTVVTYIIAHVSAIYI